MIERIIEVHGGSIKAESNGKKGATFRVLLGDVAIEGVLQDDDLVNFNFQESVNQNSWSQKLVFIIFKESSWC